MTQQIAVIGSGVAGLASAWLLSKQHRVTLIERNDYIGGHTHTIDVPEQDRTIPVDTGFIVYNERNYPLLVRMFEHFKTPTRAGDMSFAASIGPGELEYAGDNLDTLFAQRKNLLNPAFLGMLKDIVRFNRRCKTLLASNGFAEQSLGEFLERERLGAAFRDYYLLPMAAAIWSCPARTMMEFPAESLARFFANHGLISLVERPEWRTVVGGSQTYARTLIAAIGEDNILCDGATQVRRRADGVEVQLQSGQMRRFDAVVLACHADEALALLEQPTADEAQWLAPFRYQPNTTYLHTDARLMPKLRKVWSAWNYLSRARDDGSSAVSVTYWMNRLQGLESAKDYLVSLNPLTPPAADQVIAEMVYHHPVFDQAAMNAQPHLERLQGQDRLWYCGSYFGYGFHEDALRSAVNMVAKMGVATTPFVL